jgi:hypothetical protein
MPVLAALVFLAVRALAVACRIIGNGDRCDRVTRMIYARHGDARYLATSAPIGIWPSVASASPSAASRPRRRRRAA